MSLSREIAPNLLVGVRVDALLTGQLTAPVGLTVSYALNAGDR